MTAERGSNLDPNLDGIQNGLSHPTVEPDAFLDSDTVPDPHVADGKKTLVDLSPGSEAYTALLKVGVVVDQATVVESPELIASTHIKPRVELNTVFFAGEVGVPARSFRKTRWSTSHVISRTSGRR